MTTEYKQTPHGRIPKEWGIAKLGNLITYQKGKKPSTVFDRKEPNSLPYLNAETLRNGSVTQWGEADRDIITVNEDDLVLIWDGYYCGDVFTGFRGILSSTMIKIEAVESKLNKRFLFYFLKTRFRELNVKISGMYLKHVNKDVFESLRVLLPPIAEQRGIAGVLSCVDDAIRLVDLAIARIERLKKGLMQKLLTEGIGHKEYKQTPIGKTPKTWKIARLENLLELCQYGLSMAMQSEGKYPIIRMDEISDGYVTPHITKYVDLDNDVYESFKLEKGDVLFNRTNSYELVGRTGVFLLDGNYVFASYLIRLRPKKELLDPLFLTFYFMFFHNRLRHLATKAVHQANINATNLKGFTIALPPLEEQQRIAEVISSIDEKLEIEKERKEKLECIKRCLMNDLLTGRRRIRGD